jgi:deoxyribose-phosphate aldolase
MKNLAQQLVSMIDLTSLNHDDSDEKIISLCQQAQTKIGNVAAVCVYPQFVALAKQQLSNTTIAIATVVNFPDGDDDIKTVVADINNAIANGATEIDAVIPYQQLKTKHDQLIDEFVAQCKQACGDITLKAILETGELSNKEILQASRRAISGGADFLKTSTGKVAVNATLAATEIMLHAIKNSGKDIGLKASGGVRTVEQAKAYLEQARDIIGEKFIQPNTFRIGASGLLDAILKHA